MLKIVFIFILTVVLVFTKDGCVRRDFGEASFVCMCNSTYCDFTPDPVLPAGDNFIWYITTKNKHRLKRVDGKFTRANKSANIVITIDPNTKYQTVIGFGGAFSDAAGINMALLSNKTQDMLLKTYFSSNGSNYNIGRIPIGCTDFSTRKYTYDDHEGDVKLDKFALAEEDYKYKIPFIQKTLNINPNMLFLASPWTAPPWMKTNNKYTGHGYLRSEHYQTYADYLVKFIKAYRSNGIKIWALSTGNEPTLILILKIDVSTVIWTPANLSKWIAEYLGPTLENSGFNDTAIIQLEDQRYSLPWFPEDMKLISPKSYDYSKFIAVHWYYDDVVPPSLLDRTHDYFPDKTLLMTEFCTGWRLSDKPKVRLGSWDRAATVAESIITHFNHWIATWIEWNLVLDKKGNPNWLKNFVDASIIVEPTNDTFYKQPQFYVMAHFSKFVPRGSVRINWKSNDPKLLLTAFKAEDRIIVILFNEHKKKRVTIEDITRSSERINIEVPANSLNTIIWSAKK